MAEIVYIDTHPARVYVRTKYGEEVVDALKALGGHWDAAARMWWFGLRKRKAVEEALIQADRNTDHARQAGEFSGPPRKERPSSVRVYAKAVYKGRAYYVTYMGPTKKGPMAKLTTLDQEVQFWARFAEGQAQEGTDQDVARVVKTYGPVYKGYGRSRSLKQPTLADIRSFKERQADPDTRMGRCTECGHWGPYGEACQECGGEGSHA